MKGDEGGEGGDTGLENKKQILDFLQKSRFSIQHYILGFLIKQFLVLNCLRQIPFSSRYFLMIADWAAAPNAPEFRFEVFSIYLTR